MNKTKKGKDKRKSGRPMSKKYTKWRREQMKIHFNRMAKTNSLECYFYMVKMFNENEIFIKIGISVDLEQRFKACPYQYKILIKEPMILDEAWHLETLCLKKLFRDDLRYYPKIKFGGSTECFKTATVISLQKIFSNRNFVRLD